MAASIMSLSANAVVRPAGRARPCTVRASAAPKGVPSATASAPAKMAMGRRDAVMMGASVLQLLVASKAWALIPGNDDEDEELLAKAKANRVGRIQAERALEKSYVTNNDLKLDADTSKVQLAVFKLSKAGGLIESGSLALAAEALGQGAWESDLVDAGATFGKDPKEFLDDVAALRKACAGGDASMAKKAYVTAARALELFAKETKTADNVKLL